MTTPTETRRPTGGPDLLSDRLLGELLSEQGIRVYRRGVRALRCRKGDSPRLSESLIRQQMLRIAGAESVEESFEAVKKDVSSARAQGFVERCATFTDTILTQRLQRRSGILLHGPDPAFLRRITYAIARDVLERGRSVAIESTWNIVCGSTDVAASEIEPCRERWPGPDRAFLLILEEVRLAAMKPREKIVLWSIVDRRMRYRKPTILVTALDPETFLFHAEFDNTRKWQKLIENNTVLETLFEI